MSRMIILLFLLCGLVFAISQEEEKQLMRDVSELKVQTAEIKATLKTFMEQTDKRFEQIDKRFEQIERQIDRLVQIMVAIFAGQIALVATVVGILTWDRRSMARRAADEALEKYNLL